MSRCAFGGIVNLGKAGSYCGRCFDRHSRFGLGIAMLKGVKQLARLAQFGTTGFVAEMVPVPRRSRLFRVSNGFIEAVARCLIASTKCG